MVSPSAASAAKFLSTPPAAVHGFIFYGSDSSQISGRAQALIGVLSRKLGADVEIVRLHDSDLTAAPERIIGELTTGSLFGGTKIVWLTSLPPKAQAHILEAIAEPIGNAYLAVQAPDLKKSHKLVQAFDAAPYLAAIASYGEDRESLTSTIRQRFSSSGYDIGQEAAAMIAARCDFSALLARNESEKLMTFAGMARPISLEDVESCLIDQQTAGLSEIVDRALGGEGREALLAFERFMAPEQNVTPVLAVLSSTLLRLHALRTATDRGTPVMQAVKELRPPVFFKQQDTLAAQVRRWPLSALSVHIKRLNDTLKETRLKPALAEDLTAELILRIARSARGRGVVEKPFH
jgi:DNA polymerase III subunit delta